MTQSNAVPTTKQGRLQAAMRQLGGVFDPIIPGIVAAGLCAGMEALLAQIYPAYETSAVWNTIYQLLDLINVSFMTYMTAWVGYSAAQQFGATPILGGMLGMITNLDGVNALARVIGLYNDADPNRSLLSAGRGGILAVLCGAWLIAVIERALRRHMADELNIVLTPLLALFLVLIVYLLVVMPVMGWCSSALCHLLEILCASDLLIVRMLTGFIGAALFLPIVMVGMQYTFAALYSIQLEATGSVTLFPALAMAGAAQVGAGIALLIKARNTGNRRLAGIIRAGILPGMVGIATPLLYGMTLPISRTFITAGLAAGVGGAFIMAMQVASVSWGPSGLLAIPMMTAGPHGAVFTALLYTAGLLISCMLGCVFTYLWIQPEEM